MRSLLLALVMVIGCTSSGAGGDPPGGGGDPITSLPSWQLEDVNPASPRVGETYGVDAFGGKIVVVTLLLGF